jgi:hypothetical protein
MLKVSYYEKKIEQSVILIKQNCKTTCPTPGTSKTEFGQEQIMKEFV